MSETKVNMKREEELNELIRKEISSASNRRLLARMPAFRLDADMPETLSALLGELDRAEAATSASSE